MGLEIQAQQLLNRGRGALSDYSKRSRFDGISSDRILLSKLNAAAGAISDFLVSYGSTLDAMAGGRSLQVEQLGQMVDALNQAATGQLDRAQGMKYVEGTKGFFVGAGEGVMELMGDVNKNRRKALDSLSSNMGPIILVLGILWILANRRS